MGERLEVFSTLPLLDDICLWQHSRIRSFTLIKIRPTLFFTHRRNLPIRLKASLSLLLSSSPPPPALKLEAPKLLKSRARNRLSTCKDTTRNYIFSAHT